MSTPSGTAQLAAESLSSVEGPVTSAATDGPTSMKAEGAAGPVAQKAQEAVQPLRIVTWNINSYESTLAAAAADKSRCKNFADYVNRVLDADIFCIQEAKMAWKALNPSHNLEGYTSFWCLPHDKQAEKGGLSGRNGVVTFVRERTAGVKNADVISATHTIFDNTELDKEGRCIVTDHGAFVLFNVYVPNAGEEKVIRPDRTVELLRPRLDFKLAFLQQLAVQLEKVHKSGRRVILVGDLNIGHTRADTDFLSPTGKWWGYSEEEITFMDGLVRIADPTGLIQARDTAACISKTQSLFKLDYSPLEPAPTSALQNSGLCLIDTFRSCHPSAWNCTVWVTRTGGRDGQGARIDYILVDKTLYAETLENGGDDGIALRPFEKDIHVKGISQPGSACIVDVPKSWSDHVPVQFVLTCRSASEAFTPVGTPLTDSKCICWSKRMTHLTPGRTMTSFFTKSAKPATDTADMTPRAKDTNEATEVAAALTSTLSGLKRSRAVWASEHAIRPSKQPDSAAPPL